MLVGNHKIIARKKLKIARKLVWLSTLFMLLTIALIMFYPTKKPPKSIGGIIGSL